MVYVQLKNKKLKNIMRNRFTQKNLNSLKLEFKCNEDLLDRVYTSRLLGREKELVLHGGGNTSVKSTAKDTDGIVHNVIYVKGSGSDLETITPKDFPAVKLDPLINLLKKKFISDEEMVSFQRKNLIDLSSPNPSVETLVHACINKKFIDHTHSNAILEITNRRNGIALCKSIFGNDVCIIPYVMPGFLLAKKVNQLYKKHPEAKALILYKHGIFTYADDAKSSYELMLKYVNTAERFLKLEKKIRVNSIKTKKLLFKPEKISPLIRGLVSTNKKYIISFRVNKKILETINQVNSNLFLSRGVVTPDHVIRIKPKILVVNIDNCKTYDDIKKIIKSKVSLYKKNYIAYFKKYNKPEYKNKMLDPCPNILAIQNIGVFSLGETYINSIINGDVAELAIKTIGNIEKKTDFQSIPMKEIFNVEYWSLEQAKLQKNKLPLQGNITLITGGLGTIGLATAKKFKSMGSEVILVDIKDEIQFNKKEGFDIYKCDVTNRNAFHHLLLKICKKYGGIDTIISNAGFAIQGDIANLDDNLFTKSFNINLFAHQIVASESVKVMKEQNLGGCLLFNISKQSVNPGPNFGGYGIPKSALMSLCKQYALEYGSIGIRSNGVNADRIESGILTKKMISSRAKARRKTIKDYLSGNLLKLQVNAEDVADSFYSLSISKKTTAAILTVDGGNIEASLR